MARVLRMPDVADDPGSATLTAWLVGESGDFVGAQSLATVETHTSLLSIEVAEPGILIKSLVEPGDHVEPGSPLAVLGAPGEVIGDVEDLMVTLGLAVYTEAEEAGAHLRALPSDDPLYATTWPPHETVTGEAVVEELTPIHEPAPVDEPVAEMVPEPTAVEEPAVGEEPVAEEAIDEPVAEMLAEPVAEMLAEPAEVVVEPATDVLGEAGTQVLDPAADTVVDPVVDEPVVVRRVVGWADSVADAVLDAVGVVSRPHPAEAAAAPVVETAPPLPQVRLREVVRADELLEIVARTDNVSLIALLVKAVAVTSRRMPLRPDAGSLTDVAVVRAAEGREVAPVVHVASLMTVSSLSSTLADLERRAREGRLASGELEPASVTIVDLGTEGVAAGSVDATSRHPVVLTIGSVRVEPVVDGGVLVPGRVLAMALSCDAASVETGAAARWLACLAGLLEQPLRFLT